MLKIFLTLGILAVSLVGYNLGLVPGLTPSPKNLETTYTEADLQRAQEKSGVAYENLESSADPKQTIKYSGSHRVTNTFTENELTAVANLRQWQYIPVSKVQFKIHDGYGEISGLISTNKIIPYLEAVGGLSRANAEKVKTYLPVSGNLTFYVSAGASVANNDLDLNIQRIKIGLFSLPDDLIQKNEKIVEEFLEQRLEALPGAYVSSLKLENGKINFSGTLPDKEYLAP